MLQQPKPVLAWDDQLKGFGLKVLPTGKRVYLCKYRVGGGRAGRARWYTLGTHGAITCEQARELATQILAAVARGNDPQAERAAGREAPTMAELWARYEAEHLPKKKASSRVDDLRVARDYILPSLGRLKVAAVTRADIQDLHRRLSDRPYQANRLLALTSKMMNLAELWGYRPDNTNPCRHIERYPEQKRQRYLTQQELQRLGKVLADEAAARRHGRYVVTAIKLLLFTGARVSEILGARWSWLSVPDRRINLPDSKTGAKPVFLSEEAMAVLQDLRSRPDAETSDFIIKGRIAGRPLVNLAKPWKAICERADLPEVRIHDLRHTVASIGVAQGLSLPILGRLLGHSQPQTTNRYAHVDADPALTAANLIGKVVGASLDGRLEL